ncbi:MAG: threonine/serine exporter family protein, partial [Myxococcota bacterium]
VAASLAVGLLIGFLAALIGTGRARHLVVPLSATVAAALARLGTEAVAPLLFDVVVAAGLLVHLPGLTLTTALAELSTRNLVAGTARLTVAGLVLLELGFGLVIGERLGDALAPAFGLVGGEAPMAAVPLPPLATAAALGFAALSFVGIFRVRWADAPAVFASSTLAFVGARWAVGAFDGFVGAFVASLGLALACNGYARIMDRPATVPLVPAILLLVPGSVGLKSMRLALQHASSDAIETVFEMMLIGLALAVGLVAANALLTPRRDL